MNRVGWLILASWPLAAMGQAPNPDLAPLPDTLASIETETREAREAFSEAIEKSGKAASVAEIRAAINEQHARLLSLMDRALSLARLRPGESEGLGAAAWAAIIAATERGDDVAERGDAAYRLLANAPALDETAIFGAMAIAPSLVLRCPEAESFLRAVISRSRNPDLVAIARCYLGFYLAEMARMRDRLDAPVSGPEVAKELTEVSLNRCRGLDAPKLRREAEALLEQVILEDAELGLNLGDSAAAELHRLRNLRIGQPAPELVGEDIDGAPIRLSDFRGKVVVLMFWTTWSGSPSLVGGEKELIAAMEGRPFALVGVNGDAAEDRAGVKEAVAKEGFAWRSLWAGGPDGEIPRRWGVRSWPTVYTIDADGTIRDDHVGGKLTLAAFEPLVRAAEETAR
ncbi:TlpA disulfide reductase family protein [Paludisphaera sp.]|uniref:TlpA family protein disulfide reductase n=1 Tax=Paludisphaera sp. TaxID=2017432 RepID=UPI00301C4A6A